MSSLGKAEAGQQARTGWPRMGIDATFCIAALTGGRKAAGWMPPYGFSGGICRREVWTAGEAP